MFREWASVGAVVLLLAAPAAAAGSSGAAGKLRLEVKSAASGAALDGSAKKLAGKRTKVTVGGSKARVLSGTKRKVRFVVPKVSPGRKKVVARANGRRRTARLRVLDSFDGTIKVVPDTARAESKTIGTAGGTISATGADGTVYRLDLPPNALAASTVIKLTPAARINGLPLTGGGPRAVNFAPEHLELAKPGTLSITYSGAPPAKPLGFTYDSSTGEAFEIADAVRSGNTLSVPIEHFSGGGSGGSTAQDFVNVVQPIVSQPSALTTNQIDYLLDTIDRFTASFGNSFCSGQPVCLDVRQRILAELLASSPIDASQYACNPNAGSQEVHRLLVFEERWLRAGGDGASIAHLKNCRHEMLERLIADVACNDPLTQANWSQQAVTAVQLATEAATQGFFDLDDAAKAKYEACMLNALSVGAARCQQDLVHGRNILATGYAVVLAYPFGTAAEGYRAALEECVAEISVTPEQAAVDPGGSLDLTADANVDREVLWTASAGEITTTTGTFSENAVYTAPTEPGTYTVNATPQGFPEAQDTAIVTVCGASSGDELTPVGADSNAAADECLELGSDVDVTLGSVPSTAVSGESFTISGTVTNNGPDPALDVSMSLGATGIGDVGCTLGISETVATLGAGESQSLSTSATCTRPDPDDPSINRHASVAVEANPNGSGDPNTENNLQSELVAIEPPP